MVEVLLGVIFGILSGMGIGGGTFLIPALTIFSGVSQIGAQAVCLVAFIPSAIVSLIVHIKNKRINYKTSIRYSIPGCIFAIIGAVAVVFFPVFWLKKLFGVFLVAFAIFQLVWVEKQNKKP